MFVLEADDALSSISAGIDELAAEELRHVDGADLIRTWKERRRLDAEFTRRFAVFEKRDGFTADGALSGAAWLRAHCHMDAGAASDRVFTARKLLSLPETEAAFGAGEINYEHARVIARAVDSCGPEAVLEHEKVLVDVGREEVPRKLRYATEFFESLFSGRKAQKRLHRFERLLLQKLADFRAPERLDETGSDPVDDPLRRAARHRIAIPRHDVDLRA